MSPKAQLEQEKRQRREIANSNERRRMQSINQGFTNLKNLMPQLNGEKLSKASILQHTTEYIAKLEQDHKRAASQNEQLKRMLMELGHVRDLELQQDTPPPKRKKRDTECSDEGIGMLDSNQEPLNEGGGVDDLRRQMMELRAQLERERLMRLMMEERARSLESQLLQGHPPHLPHLPTQLHSPINLKVESVNKMVSSVQEVSLPIQEDRVQSELAYHRQVTTPPTPATRNLENLVEAIRQIEGDRILCDDKYLQEERQHHAAFHGAEDSEKEGSVSDPDEPKSGRDSPVGLCLSLSAPAAAHQNVLSEKYPIATHLLHRPPFPHLYRPNVIVHKS